jgi:Zn-dependent protease with chaperone function
VLIIIGLTATATVCLSVVFIVAIVGISYANNRAHHRALLSRARQITPQDTPGLAAIADESAARLQPGDVQAFVAPGDTLNAYTFGLLPPKIVVLHSALLQVMDKDELCFILGHELGHIRLGHTWLNSLVGGMAGIPSPFLAATLLAMAFLWWNRACEFSADRAGLLACGKPHKAISALVKLAAGPSARTRTELERALRHIEAEDDHALSNLGEALATHPMMIRRIEQLQRYAASAEYRRLQALVNRNVAVSKQR